MTVQSRLGSTVEVFTKTFSGFVVNLLMWMYVVGPIFDIPTPPGQALAVTCIFTLSALARGYVVRRFFNWRTERKLAYD